MPQRLLCLVRHSCRVRFQHGVFLLFRVPTCRYRACHQRLVRQASPCPPSARRHLPSPRQLSVHTLLCCKDATQPSGRPTRIHADRAHQFRRLHVALISLGRCRTTSILRTLLPTPVADGAAAADLRLPFPFVEKLLSSNRPQLRSRLVVCPPDTHLTICAT